MSIICVEGCDGAGKTTLIERARENQRERYFIILRYSRYPPNVKTALQWLHWVKAQRDLDMILDRSHFISDRVYGPILRDIDLFKDFPIEFGLQDVSVIVYARPPAEVIRENIERTKQMSGVRENLDALINGYDKLMDSLRGRGKRILQYDYTTDDPSSFWRHAWAEAMVEKRSQGKNP